MNDRRKCVVSLNTLTNNIKYIKMNVEEESPLHK